MVKRFCFFFGFKNGAIIMCFISFLTGVGLIVDCAMTLTHKTALNYNSFIVVGFLMGFTSLIAGWILASAIWKGNERYVLIYMLLQSVVLFIATIYSGMFVFTDASVLFILLLCGLLWYGVYCIYGFYTEMAEYNSAKPGVYEISYTDNAAYVTTIPNGVEVENTAV